MARLVTRVPGLAALLPLILLLLVTMAFPASAKDPSAILLCTRTLDPQLAAGSARTVGVSAAQWLVQLEASSDRPIVEAALGATFLGLVPPATWRVVLSPIQVMHARQLREIVWLTPVEAEDKISLDIVLSTVSSVPSSAAKGEYDTMHAETDASRLPGWARAPPKPAGAEQELSQATRVRVQYVDGHVDIVDLSSDPTQAWQQVQALAQETEVVMVEPVLRPSLSNHYAAFTMQAGHRSTTDLQTPLYDHGLRGAGQVIAVGDTGVDSAHCAFGNKIVRYISLYGNPGDAEGGHGTHVAGSILGNGGWIADGMAPHASLVVQDIGIDDAAGSLALPPRLDTAGPGGFFAGPYAEGARIYTNSWGLTSSGSGSNTGHSYLGLSRDTDAFVAAHPDLLVLFAAGNSGRDGTSSVLNPGVAKNILSVGASSATLPQWQDLCTRGLFSAACASVLAESPRSFTHTNVAEFSSRGPTIDGRIKPDVVVPGDWTLSAHAGSVCEYSIKSGTSMATPTLAGGAALVRQWLVDGYYPSGQAMPDHKVSSPSAALLRALIINAAVWQTGDLGGTRRLLPLPRSFNQHAGFGRVELMQVLFFHDTLQHRSSWIWSDDGTANAPPAHVTSVGETLRVCRSIAAGQPLRVTLAWTDPVADAGAAQQLVNDLDLVIEAPDHSRFLGNEQSAWAQPGRRDSVNNVEKIVVDAPMPGPWCFQVSAAALPAAPQAFALVVSGGGADLAQAVFQAECVASPSLCDDGNACTRDDCDSITGCSNVIDDTQSCLDASACNGAEFCRAGVCMPGTPVLCDDGNPCTHDACSDAQGGCFAENLDAGTLCRDADLCNGDEVCDGAGTCLPGVTITCDDGNACTRDECHAAMGCRFVSDDSLSCDDADACSGQEVCRDGVCIHLNPVVCNDGDVCTADVCVDGLCQAPRRPSGAACHNDDVCDGAEACNADGECVPGQPLVCDDGNPCTRDQCDAAIGCVYSPDPASLSCVDDDRCNGDEVCTASGECVSGEPLDCAASAPPCHSAVCDTALGCVYTPDDLLSCDDADVCNGAELCQEGICVAGTPLSCDDGNDCTADVCDPAAGCVHTPLHDTACDDGVWCNGVDKCSNGVCGPAAAGVSACDDANPCTQDTCDETRRSCSNDVDLLLSCSDGDVCNGEEVCQADGQCALAVGSAPLDCDDDNSCTLDSCDPVVGCVHVPDDAAVCDTAVDCDAYVCRDGACVIDDTSPACDDGNPCTRDRCDEERSLCVHENDRNLSCDDGNACNGVESCNGFGQCRVAWGSEVSCNDDNPCTDDVCDSRVGACVFTPNQASCSDGSVCNGQEVCGDGACQPGEPLVCDDGNPCTKDRCQEWPAGGCVFSNDDRASCDDGNACNGYEQCRDGQCVVKDGSVPDCDDGNACTRDQCLPDRGCVSEPDDALTCADSNLCDGTEVCVAGECVRASTDLICDDANACTDDRCIDAIGCVHVANDYRDCDDDDVCTGVADCVDGACVLTAQPLDCDDGNPCTRDECDARRGCSNTPDDSLSCGDGDVCTGQDACRAGQCVLLSPALACNDGNTCTQDMCDAERGCVYQPRHGASCDDGDVCNGEDHCEQAVCVHSNALVCDDGDGCTEDLCDPGIGCVARPISGCNYDCAALSCDDGLPCTHDTCDPGTGCVHIVDNDARCDTGDACDGVFTCRRGICEMDAPRMQCQDDNPCTRDVCREGQCRFEPDDDLACDDGDVCTGVEACRAGECVSSGLPPLSCASTQRVVVSALAGGSVAAFLGIALTRYTVDARAQRLDPTDVAAA